MTPIRTTNWQTKALTLFIAAVAMTALLSMVACESKTSGPTEHVWSDTYKRIMPLGQCPNDINARDASPDRTLEEKRQYALEKMNEYHRMLLETNVRMTGGGVTQMENQFGNWDFINYPEYGEVTFIEIRVNDSDIDVDILPNVGENPLCFNGVPVHFVTDQPYGELE